MHMTTTSTPRLLAAVLAAAALGVVTAATATADPPQSTLVANPAAVTFDIGGTTSAPVNVGLDAGCINPLNNGQSYTIVATSGSTAVAAVSPGPSAELKCGQTAPFAVSTTAWSSGIGANNTAACAAVGSTSLRFTPVISAGGLQKKLHGVDVPVTVTDTADLCGDGGGGGGGGGGGTNPAAPAVANGALNTDPALSALCKKRFGNAKSWRGSTISFIADWMPKPESIKDADGVKDIWATYVVNELNTLCGGATDADAAAYPTTYPALSGYRST
jgi:hypothetical protein